MSDLSLKALSDGMTGGKQMLADVINGVLIENGSAQQLIEDHLEDKINHIPYAVATGVANAYTVTLTPAPTAYTDGMAVCVKINVASTGPSTLKMNTLAAKSIKDSLGNALTASNNLKLNTPYTLRYESVSDSFILQGKGGGGNTIASHVLLNDTCTTDTGPITGTMANKPGVTSSVSTTVGGTTLYLRIPQGAYITNTASGYPEVTATDPNFIASNILSGKSVFGLAGTAVPGGIGNTFITASSHPTTNAPVDLASIRLEFYSRIFPNNLASIRVLKNGAANVYGSSVINTVATGNATDEESLYITLNESFYPGTTYNVIIADDSIEDKLGNNFKGMNYQFVTNSNPSVWATNPNSLNVSREYFGGCGTQSASLVIGGNGQNFSTSGKSTENFNGTSWSYGAGLGTSVYRHAATGNQNSAIYAGGYGDIISAFGYNGISWASIANMLTGRSYIGLCGTASSALQSGGSLSSDGCSLFNGTSWSTVNAMTRLRYGHGAVGTTSAALAFSGYTNGSALTNTSEKFNGTTWSASSNVSTYRQFVGSAGTQDSALGFGGLNTTNVAQTLTEKFNGASWSTTNNLNTARSGSASAGSATSALASGGHSVSDFLSSSEKFFG